MPCEYVFVPRQYMLRPFKSFVPSTKIQMRELDDFPYPILVRISWPVLLCLFMFVCVHYRNGDF